MDVQVDSNLDSNGVPLLNLDDVTCKNYFIYSYGGIDNGKNIQQSRIIKDEQKFSCCNKNTEENMAHIWDNIVKPHIKGYVESYIWLLKASFNYLTPYISWANNYMQKGFSDDKCKAAAQGLIQLGLDANLVD